MSSVRPVADDGLRIIMCLAFDHRAPVQDVAAFKATLVECDHVISCCDLYGSFDLMIELEVPDLRAYNQQLEGMKGQLATLVSRYESNFVCNRLVRVERGAPDPAVWVPCNAGVRRIDCSLIDKVTAEGDYMRIHAKGHSWLIHVTMREILERLDADSFVQLHRSATVRCGFVERLVHEGRAWTARLADGSIERIARSHLASVMTTLRANSASNRAASSKGAPSADAPIVPAETSMQRRR